MRQVRAVSHPQRLPTWRQWQQLPRLLSKMERRVLQGAGALIICALVFMTGWYVLTHRVEVPAVGGEYTEGLVGEPRFINPLYASASDVDADLSRLIYSGLMRWEASEGLVPDLAAAVTVSEDGKTYTMGLRDDARFHNGEPVRAQDVVFTFEAIQNPQYRSPLAVSFQNVQVTQVDDKTVAFTLDEPFAPFLSTLTAGILPADIWSDIPPRNTALAELNVKPIGSGPYAFSEFTKDKKGAIQSYTLVRHPNYHGEKAFIERVTFKFYPDAAAAMDALANRYVEGVGFVPPDHETAAAKNRSVTLLRPSMPRETLLVFNQEYQPIFKKEGVRKAVALALDKPAILETVLGGHGSVLDSAIPLGLLGAHPDVPKIARDVAAANQLLDAAGYPLPEGAAPARQTTVGLAGGQASVRLLKKDAPEELAFILTTIQNPEFIRTAELIAEQLAEIGMKITVEAVAPEQFASTVLEPRGYDLLLTGLLFGTDPDPYPFWHSSQAKAGGLNLAGYSNRKADALLEEARKAIDEAVRIKKYRAFQELVASDLPAVFLYQSTYTYAVASKIKNVSVEKITTPADRFANVEQWYIKTRKTLR